MKKYGLILIVLLLLIVSIAFNYRLNNKLNTSITLSENLELELVESDVDNDALESEVSALVEEMGNINILLQEKTEALNLIDDKLEAEGEILERIDELLSENGRLEKELNTALLESNILKEENSKKIEGVIITESQLEQWDTDLQDILESLEARISFLEEGISILSPLSLERIMVNQEIDFLEETYLSIEQVKNDISDE